ncbi:hypothetical protein TNCV_1914371 [Trichonephila clavipes]|nr:hypothetical protein TNCV_1914371 [Trichonephila clavipes]
MTAKAAFTRIEMESKHNFDDKNGQLIPYHLNSMPHFCTVSVGKRWRASLPTTETQMFSVDGECGDRVGQVNNEFHGYRGRSAHEEQHVVFNYLVGRGSLVSLDDRVQPRKTSKMYRSAYKLLTIQT